MEILLTLMTVIAVFNTLLTIGIAGSVAKLIRSLNTEDQQNDRQKWAQMIRSRRSLQLKEGNSPTYADMLAIESEERSGPRGWDGIPRSKNWDGIPRTSD